jgi:hypothetical protein
VNSTEKRDGGFFTCKVIKILACVEWILKIKASETVNLYNKENREICFTVKAEITIKSLKLFENLILNSFCSCVNKLLQMNTIGNI